MRRRYRGYLIDIASGDLPTADDASEVVDSAFFKAFQALGTYRTPGWSSSAHWFAFWLRTFLLEPTTRRPSELEGKQP